MKFKILDIPPAGTWKRDCELINFNFFPLSLEILKDSDQTKWKIIFDGFIAFKVTSEEFTVHLQGVPSNGSFYLIEDSPWIQDLSRLDADVLKKFHHFVLFLYDEIFEIISQKINYEKIG